MSLFDSVGWLHLMNLFAPERGMLDGKWVFDLAIFEQRMVASCLLRLAYLKEITW